MLAPVPAPSRILFLDWMRGLAAIVMLQGHAFDSFLRPELREHPAYIFSQFVGGQAAAVFLFLTGITFGLGMNRRDKLPAWQRVTGALRRARYLFLLAIAFRVQMLVFGYPYQPWTDLLRVDVLNVMAATAVLLSAVALARGMRRVRWAAAAGGLLAALAPVMSGLEIVRIAGPIRDYFVPSAAAFSVFPWGSYLAFGLAAGSAIPFVKAADWSRVMQWAALGGFGLLLGGRYFGELPYSIYSHTSYWLNSPALVACKLGVILLLGSAAFLWTAYFSEGWSWVRLLGMTSLAVYWVHIELVYGRWFWLSKGNLTVWGCIGASAALILAMIGMSAAIRYLPWRSWVPGRWKSARPNMPAEPPKRAAGGAGVL